ncbi:MAG: PilZ domain-containing protein [Emcibacter sp.]|nr:PilZ domain-containing protein [Emcibacter sp.]
MSKTDKKIAEEITRRFARQPVLLKAMLDTGQYEFECIAYDLSLNGVKVKLDLPLATKCEVWLMVKDCPHIPARVVWSKDGYIGVEFIVSAKKVAEMLGSIGERMLKK